MSEPEIVEYFGHPFTYRKYRDYDSVWWNISTPHCAEPFDEYSGDDIARCLNRQHVEILQLEAKVSHLQESLECANKLLACYRLGRRPPESLLRKIDKLQKQATNQRETP